jgi:hypothetical protein
MNQQPSEPILLAQQAKADFREARRRYYAALVECLPVGTPIWFTAHNGRKYDGVIAGPPSETGYVKIRNNVTHRAYEIAIYLIEGL